jgi:predicted ATP-dependent protease
MSAIGRDDRQPAEPVDIDVTAQGDRRTIEALYLELRELAQQSGLKIEYRLSFTKPESQDRKETTTTAAASDPK